MAKNTFTPGDTIAKGSHITVILKPKRLGATGGRLTHDYSGRGTIVLEREADIEWSGFGPRPTGMRTVTVSPERIRTIFYYAEEPEEEPEQTSLVSDPPALPKEEERHEVNRLFNAPTTMRGQMDLGFE